MKAVVVPAVFNMTAMSNIFPFIGVRLIGIFTRREVERFIVFAVKKGSFKLPFLYFSNIYKRIFLF